MNIIFKRLNWFLILKIILIYFYLSIIDLQILH